MLYVQFFDARGEILGSDGYCPLDGRLNKVNGVNIAIDQANRKKEVKHITGFQIRKGSLTKFINVTNIFQYNNRK